MNEVLKPQLDNQFPGILMQHSQYPAKMINEVKLKPTPDLLSKHPECFSKVKIRKGHFSIPYLHKSHNTPLLPPTFCMIIVWHFSWDIKMSQEKSKTMPMQILGGLKEVYYGIAQVGNTKCSLKELPWSKRLSNPSGYQYYITQIPKRSPINWIVTLCSKGLLSLKVKNVVKGRIGLRRELTS